MAMQADVGEEADVVGLFKRVDSWRGSEPLTALVNNAAMSALRRHVARRSAKAFRSLFGKQSLNGAPASSQSDARLPKNVSSAPSS